MSLSAWITIAALLKLREEFNALSPDRDKGADGTVADSAHASTSDHAPDEDSAALRGKDADSVNEVHALDIDSTGPWPVPFRQIVMFIVGRCRTGAENRLRYVIYDRVIYHVDDDFAGRAYTLADPHINHAHFSGSYLTAREASTASWHLEDIPVALTDADKKWISQEIADRVAAAVPRYTLAITSSVTEELPEAVFTYARQQPKAPYSDTARNLLEARLSKALLDGVAIPPYPSNAAAAAAK